MKKLFYKKKNNIFKIFFFILITLFILKFQKKIIFNNNNYIINNILKIYDRFNNFKVYINNIIETLNNNKNILYENNKLKEKISYIKIENLLLKNINNNNKKIKEIFNICNKNNKYIIKSKVISNDKLNYFFIINKGKKDNIKIGSPVVNENGVIGQISEIFEDFSKVLLIYNKYHYIPVKIKRNNNNFIIKGYGYKKELYIYSEMPIIYENEIISGDILLSSGKDNKFPENIPVAEIKYIKINNNRINKILIKPIFDDYKIKNVFIILNKNYV